MRRLAAALALAGVCMATSAAAGPRAAAPATAMYPSALHGSWGPHPLPCRASDVQDDAMRFTIHAGERSSGKYRDMLLSITQIAEAPLAWWAVSTSLPTATDASGDTAGKARIYVLAGDTMVVTDGARADTWVRCT